jgi:hypothetical protein
MAVIHACKEVIWLMKMCLEVGLSQRGIIVQYDSNNTFCLAKNPTFHAKTKYIDIQYHFFRDMVEDVKVILDKVDTLQNASKSLTKPMSTGKFKWCCEFMSLIAPSN